MTTVLQIDFPADGPFGAEMAEAYADLAASIKTEPGLIWKVWTEDQDAKLAGGIYLFADDPSARAYLDMHSQRLEGLGMTGVRALVLDVNEALTAITRGPTG